MTTGIGLASRIEAHSPKSRHDATDLVVSGDSVVIVEAPYRASAAVRYHVEHTALREGGTQLERCRRPGPDLQERSVETRTAATAFGISRGTRPGSREPWRARTSSAGSRATATGTWSCWNP